MEKQVKVALIMAASLFMEFMDGTIVTTALPDIGKELKVSASSGSLLISTYLITVAIFIPLSGWLAKKYGKKRIWLIAVLIFMISSLGSALAFNFEFLVAMRIIQGFAGSLMTPTARLIVLEKAPADQLLKLISYLVWPALTAPAIAPLLGGIIVTHLSWHWIFLINLPIGCIIFILGYHWLVNDKQNANICFDWLGFINLAVASAILLIGTELITYNTRLLGWSVMLIIIGLILAIGCFYYLKTTAAPLFSLNALKIPSFRIFQTGGSLFWISVGALPYTLTILLQTIFGWSADRAGFYVVFIFIGNISIKPFTNQIIKRLKFRGALVSAFILVMVSSVGLAFINKNVSIWWLISLAVISGIGRSLALTIYNGLSFSEVPTLERNSANTLNAVTQSLAQGMGISVITMVVYLVHYFGYSMQVAYSAGFIFLAILIIFPLLEVLQLDKNIGSNALK